jgi:hypothetical protein
MCYPPFHWLTKSVLIAADDALKSAAEARNGASVEVDEKFRKAIRLLSDFEKTFPPNHPTSDPIFGGSKPESPSTILNGLKNNFHAKVKLPFVSLPLNSDGS